MPKPSRNEKQDDQIRFLADRLAILLVVCMSRTGSWDPWMREGLYEDEDSLGEEVRTWPVYRDAMMVVRYMLDKHNKQMEEAA